MENKIKFSREEQKDFNFWKRDGNVSKNEDGSYSTQDSQWTNRLKDLDALKQYYYKEFISDTPRYAGGGRTMKNRAKKQAIKDIKSNLWRPQAPYQSVEKPSEEWERYELPYDTKLQYDFEPDSFSVQGKRYSEFARGGETKTPKKYIVKGNVYDGGEIWKETFDNIDEAYELAYQIQNGWTDDGTYYLITIYDEKGKKVATISDDKYFNELTEHKFFKKVLLGADTKKERQLENEKLKGYKFNLQVRIADGGATGIFDKTFDSIFDVMDKMNTYYEEDYYALINDEGLDYWEDKYSEIDLSRNYIKGKYGWSFVKENNYWIAKDDYDNNHIVRIVNGKPTSDSSITKGALKQILELEAQKKYSEKPKHNKSLSDMKKIWDGLSDNYKERENIVFLIGYSGGQLREVVPYKFNDFNKSFQIQIMNAYFGQTEEQKQKIINKNRKEHEALVKNYPRLKNLYGKKYADGGEIKVNGMTKQDYIDAYLKRVDSVIENLKQKGQYDSEDFDLLGEVDKEGGFTEIEDVGYWLNWAEINGNYDALIQIVWLSDYTEHNNYQLDTLAHFFFGKPIKIDLYINSSGDSEYDYNTELQKIKLLLYKIDFDKITGEINYEEMENNTDLKFYKNGTLVMSLNGDWNEESEELHTTIDIDGETTELNYHPLDSMGGVNMQQLKKNINEAFKELNTYSAVVSIEGYEEYAENVEGLENAKSVIQDIKGNTRFQVLKGSSVGIGKRVDTSRVVEEFAKGGEAGFDDTNTSMLIYHEKKGNFMIPKNQIYLWLYEGEGVNEKLASGEYDYVFYPYASISIMGQRGFIPPLKKIWTKKFQKQTKGSEHLLGVIKAFLIEEDGKKELYIDMMSVNPTKKKKGVMSYMIKDLRDTFNLTQDQVTFSNLTEDGKKFVVKKTYADGGQPVQYVPVQQMPQQPVQYVPVQQMPQQPVQYVPVQQMPQQSPQQPVNSPLGNLDINSAINFVKENPQVLALLKDGGEASEFKKGGNVSSIEKRVAEVNALIKEGNDKGVQVIDKTTTWEAPMKYNPIKYTNGVLYVSYKQLDLYKYKKGMGSEWKNESYRIGKNEMGENISRGSAQTDALSYIARMYRSAINDFNKYGYNGGGRVKTKEYFQIYKLEDLRKKTELLLTDVELNKFIDTWNLDYNTDYADWIEFNEYEDSVKITPVFSKNEYGGNVNNSFVESEINGVTNWENEEIASYLQMPVNEVAKNREFYVEETQNAMLVNQVDGDYAKGGMVGSEIEFNKYGETRTGTIYEDFQDNTYAVQSGTSKILVDKDDILRTIKPKKETSFSFFDDGGDVENKIQLKNFSDLKQGDVIRKKEKLGTTIFVVNKSPVQSRIYKNEYDVLVTCIVSNTNFYKPLEEYYITSVIKYGKLGNVDYLGKWNYDDKIDYSIYLPKSNKKYADGGDTSKLLNYDQLNLDYFSKKYIVGRYFNSEEEATKYLKSILDKSDNKNIDDFIITKDKNDKSLKPYRIYPKPSILELKRNEASEFIQKNGILSSKDLRYITYPLYAYVEYKHINKIKELGVKYNFKPLKDINLNGVLSRFLKENGFTNNIIGNELKLYNYGNFDIQDEYSLTMNDVELIEKTINDLLKKFNKTIGSDYFIKGTKLVQTDSSIKKGILSVLDNQKYDINEFDKKYKQVSFRIERGHNEEEFLAVIEMETIDKPLMFRPINNGINYADGGEAGYELENYIISGKNFKNKYATDFNGQVAKVIYTKNLDLGSNLGKGSYWNVTQDSLDIYSGNRDEELDSKYGQYFKNTIYKKIDDNLKIFVKDEIADELWDNEKLYNKIKNISDGIYDPSYDDYGLLLFENQYADGGNVPHADKMFQLPLEMVIYVPSTQDVDKVISVDKMDKRVDEVKKYLANKFGGYTSADKLGGFVDSTGNLVNEDVVQVTSFSTKEAYAENKEELINQLAKWGEEWGQESIGFEFEGDLMYVPQKFKQGGEVDRFSDYSNDALSDMIINLSRYENTEKEIQIVKAELKKRKGENKDIEE